MNSIVEAVCRHIKRKDQIAGIEMDFSRYRIFIYLRDGSVRKYSMLATCKAQFMQRWERARQIFPHIDWYVPGDAIPDWVLPIPYQSQNAPENSQN